MIELAIYFLMYVDQKLETGIFFCDKEKDFGFLKWRDKWTFCFFSFDLNNSD
jgi:hypothetical protein